MPSITYRGQQWTVHNILYSTLEDLVRPATLLNYYIGIDKSFTCNYQNALAQNEYEDDDDDGRLLRSMYLNFVSTMGFYINSGTHSTY